MDDTALVSRLFHLWSICEEEYQKRYEKAINVEVVKAIFERADHHIIAAQIQKERSGVRAQQEKQQDEPPTEKQIQYARDLGCENPENMTRKELSDWIDEHKSKGKRGSYKWSR